MGFQSGQTLSYQRMLRALGSYLDEERPKRITLIEVPDGFTLLTERNPDDPKLEERHFTRAELAKRSEQLMRAHHAQRDVRNAWRLSPSGYEDFLRALGFELDDAQAHAILLDELDDELLVTYSYLDPSQGYSWRKHMVTIGGDEASQVLHAAYNRKQKRFLGIF